MEQRQDISHDSVGYAGRLSTATGGANGITMLVPRSYWDEPPPARTFEDNKPTLLASWWCTAFAMTIILLRLGARYMRMEHLLREDKIMSFAILPLLCRMGLVHVVLLWGTNNADTTWLTDEDIQHREIGSRLVLAARIMFAAT